MQRAKNLHKFRSVICFSIAIINVLVSIPLCIKFGAVGAAIGTVASLIIGNGLIMNIYYHKKVGIDIIYFWRNILSILPALIIPTLYGIFVSIVFPLNNISMFVIQSVIMVILYCASIWMFGMNVAEKQMIAVPIKKLLRRSK